MPEYAGVTTGTLTVNGHDITIDPMTTTVGGLVAALNGVGGVSASLDQASGAVRIWSDGAGSLTLSDTSGVLEALGIEAGTVHGTPGSVEEVTTVTGQSTTSNAREVADKVTSAVEELNAALEGLSSDRLQAALEDVVQSLHDRGVRGVRVGSGDDEAALVVDSAELVESLNGIAEDIDLERVLADVLGALDAAAAAALEPDDSPAGAQVVRLELFRAELMAGQAAGSLLHVRTSLQPREPAETTRKTVLKAYGVQG
jgi:hypothetical protein